MAKKFKIAEFESFFPARVLEEGLDISEFSSDWKLAVNNDLVSATFSPPGIQPANVTIHRTSNLVLSFECDCTVFSPGKGCKHVAAVFYMLHIQQSRLTPVHSGTRHSVDTYLEVTDRQELNAFVKFYAANNAAFNKLFKQYFSYKSMATGLNFDGYLQQMIRGLTDNKGKTSPGNRKLMSQIFELHLHRSDQLILHHEWQESASVVMAVLEKVISFATHHPGTFNTYLTDKSHNNLKLILSQMLAPDLRRSIMLFLIHLIGQDNYHYHGPYHAIVLFLESQPDGELAERMTTVLADKLNEPADDQTGKWLYFLFMLHAAREDFDLVKFYIHYLVPDERFKQFLQYCLDKEIKLSSILRIIDFYMRQTTSQIPGKIDSMIASYAISQNNGVLYKALFKRLRDLKISEEEIANLLHLPKAISNTEMASSLHANGLFENETSTFKGPHLQMLFMAGELPLLFEMLASMDDLTYLKIYLIPILQFDTNAGMELLLGKTKEFLTSHVGEYSNTLIDDMIRKLIFEGWVDEARQLKSAIMDDFGDRIPLRNRLKSFAL